MLSLAQSHEATLCSGQSEVRKRSDCWLTLAFVVHVDGNKEQALNLCPSEGGVVRCLIDDVLADDVEGVVSDKW